MCPDAQPWPAIRSAATLFPVSFIAIVAHSAPFADPTAMDQSAQDRMRVRRNWDILDETERATAELLISLEQVLGRDARTRTAAM